MDAERNKGRRNAKPWLAKARKATAAAGRHSASQNRSVNVMNTQ
jgi:hypothetical protein